MSSAGRGETSTNHQFFGSMSSLKPGTVTVSLRALAQLSPAVCWRQACLRLHREGVEQKKEVLHLVSFFPLLVQLYGSLG